MRAFLPSEKLPHVQGAPIVGRSGRTMAVPIGPSLKRMGGSSGHVPAIWWVRERKNISLHRGGSIRSTDKYVCARCRDRMGKGG